MTNRPDPRGQVLVIVAASMLVLLAVGAIAIDLGFSWMLRRQEQNAADAGAIAAARHITSAGINMPGAEVDACFFAQQNGFFDGDLACAAALASGALDVNYPPEGVLAGNFAGSPYKVQVVISATHPSFFARAFGQTEATVVTGAVAANDKGNANASSLVALDPSGCDGISEATAKFSGGGTVVIFPLVDPVTGLPHKGGYVQVNSDCAETGHNDVCDGGSGKSGMKISGGGTVDVSSSGAFTAGTCKADGGGTLLGPLQEGTLAIGDPLGQLAPPPWEAVVANYGYVTCPGEASPLTEDSASGCSLNAAKCGGDICSLEPGVYFGGLEVKKKDLQVELQPGIYYIAGGGITVGTDASIASVSGDPTVDARIMIYSTDHPTKCASTPQMCQGPISFGAQTSFSAKAIDTAVCQTPPHQFTCPYRGILIWQAANGEYMDNEVGLGGQNSSVVSGTIYAPDELVDLNGGSSGDGCGGTPPSCLAVQIISWQFNITGGGTLHMPYDPGGLYQFMHRGLVH